MFLKYLFPKIKIYYSLLEKYFLYACAEPLFYFADNMLAPIFVRDVQILFAVYNYLFVGFNILFAKKYVFVRNSTYVRAFLKKI